MAVTSCTAGMHIACKALGFNSKSTMYTSVISFVSSANVGKYLGGNVDFIDIDEDTVNMCTKNLETKIKIKKLRIKSGRNSGPTHDSGRYKRRSVVE